MQLGLQGLVSQARLLRIQFTNDQAKRLGVGNHRSNMGFTLFCVGIQQGVVRQSTHDCIEFPGQVVGVTDTGTQALSQKGRHLVSRIPHQKHPPLSPLLHHQGVETVHRRAAMLKMARVHKFAQHSPHRVMVGKVLGGLTRHQFDFPAPQMARTNDVGARPRRPAVLHTALWQLEGAANPGIHHDPPFVKRQVFNGGAELLAHGAGGPVCSHHILRLEGQLLPIGQALDPSLHVTLGRLQVQISMPGQRRHLRKPSQA